MQINIVKQSRCLTCERLKRTTNIFSSRDANKHQADFPDHHVQIIEEEAPSEEKSKRQLGTVLVIPKKNFNEHGHRAYVTTDTFESFLEARAYFPEDDFDIVWPAKQDIDGFYTEPE